MLCWQQSEKFGIKQADKVKKDNTAGTLGVIHSLIPSEEGLMCNSLCGMLYLTNKEA